MYAKDFIIDDSCKCQIIEDFCTVAPYINWSILSETFVIETVDLSDLSALVISTDKSYSFRVADLQSQKQEKSLNRWVSSVNKISHE